MSTAQPYFNSPGCFPLAFDKRSLPLSAFVRTIKQQPKARRTQEPQKPENRKPDSDTMGIYILPTGIKSWVKAEQHRGLKQSAILQHWLQLNSISSFNSAASDGLRDALIIGLDAEWFEYESSFVTELGVSILDPRLIKCRDTPWDILKTMVNHHVRIKPNAHMINKDLCSGNPQHFQFGKSTYVEIQEAKDMLHDLFVRMSTKELNHRRPVILLGHAVDNDEKMIKERFGLCLDSLGVVVATIDTQDLAVEARLISAGRKIRLTDLLGKFDIAEEYLHNAGNDIVCTTIAALLMQYPPKKTPTAYGELKKQLQTSSKVTYGVETWCFECGSTEHVDWECKADLDCDYCWWKGLWDFCVDSPYAHTMEKCLEGYKKASGIPQSMRKPLKERTVYAIPCQHCIESPDPKRHNMAYAYDHKTKECVWETDKAALLAGKIKCLPPPGVVGEGLEHIQETPGRSEAGVSATKHVVEL